MCKADRIAFLSHRFSDNAAVSLQSFTCVLQDQAILLDTLQHQCWISSELVAGKSQASTIVLNSSLYYVWDRSQLLVEQSQRHSIMTNSGEAHFEASARIPNCMSYGFAIPRD